MTDPVAPTPYPHFPGTAREALDFYCEMFGGSVQAFSFEDFGRTDGPPEAIAHGYLTGGSVLMFVSDAVGDEPSLQCQGLMLSLLGTADASVLRDWFLRLSEGGLVVDELKKRPWGATDGQVVDRYGLHWLIGFEDDDGD